MALTAPEQKRIYLWKKRGMSHGEIAAELFIMRNLRALLHLQREVDDYLDDLSEKTGCMV